MVAHCTTCFAGSFGPVKEAETYTPSFSGNRVFFWVLWFSQGVKNQHSEAWWPTTQPALLGLLIKSGREQPTFQVLVTHYIYSALLGPLAQPGSEELTLNHGTICFARSLGPTREQGTHTLRFDSPLYNLLWSSQEARNPHTKFVGPLHNPLCWDH